MPKVRKPGWYYIYSEELKQEIAYSEKTGWVFCEDGTKYSPKEIQVIKDNGGMIALAAHILKKTFGGELVNGKPGTNQGEPSSAGVGAGCSDSESIHTNIPKRAESLQAAQNGDLDIF